MTTKNIYQRLAAVMEEVTYIQKQKKQGMQYTIVSHDAVTAKVRPALLKHGVIYHPVRCEHSHNGNRAECAMTVRFVNVDAPADFFEVPTFGYGIDPQDKGPGKAMSYAVKYALLKALGLETGDDPDNDSVAHEPAPEKPAVDHQATFTRLSQANAKLSTLDEFNKFWKTDSVKKASNGLPRELFENLMAEHNEKSTALMERAAMQDYDPPADFVPPSFDSLEK